MGPTPPRFTIIVVVMNRDCVIQRCIDSVTCQDYDNKQLVIIDGASTDRTVEIIKKNSSDIDFWLSEPDRGIYHAMNKGVSHSTGDWIMFLGADDFLMDPGVLRRVADRLCGGRCETKLVYGRVAVVSDEGDLLGEWGDINHQIWGLPHQGTFHHRSFFETHGSFDESFKIAGDYELLLRELKSAKASYMPDMVIAGFSNGGVSTDLGSAPTYWIEYARAQKMNGIFPYSAGWIKCMSLALCFWTMEKLLPAAWADGVKERYARTRLRTACGMNLEDNCECGEARFVVLTPRPISLAPNANELDE
jgi:glycosyltransferase involved in cell wall biosynthesis